jgi:hypothetical protein
MVEGDDASITNMKFILYCFECMSGLKINYHKSEAYIFGMDEDNKRRISNMLNCQLRELPMRYLDIPLSDSKLGMGALAEIPGKLQKKPPWKGRHTSSRGRLTLTNSCLSSLPIYVMGFYLLPPGTHRKMDNLRSNFYWKGASEDLKYHMVKWSAICRPKEFGGLGIINTQILNECLMTK